MIKVIFKRITWHALYLIKQGMFVFLTKPKNIVKNNNSFPKGNKLSKSSIGRVNKLIKFKQGNCKNK